MESLQRRHSSPLRTASILLLILLIGSGCRRSQQLAETTAEREAALRTTQWLDQKFGFVGDPKVLALTHRVMTRLGEAVYGTALETDLSGSEAQRFQNYPWQAYVIDSEKPNAFSAGAGMIFISRGMVAALKSEAELAAIISHEMAHELLGHTRAALESSGSKSGPRFVYTLEHEIAADSLGLHLLSVARYSPRAAIDAIQDATASRRNASGEYTHWLPERLANLQSALMKLPPATPATENTREFNHARNILLAGK